MARKIIWTSTAIVDVNEISRFISRDSEYYAKRTVDRIHEVAQSLTEFPFSSRVVPEYGRDDIREVFVYDYRLMYRVTEQSIYIVAVIHVARDISDWSEAELN
ncbi:MAG: type II toxin-antitoxin system RelE/ParE family toxin [Candidatus Hatepunaea meridiana]|nr:type II toxin-antitoxin system RelE/ParE family toxin [Candidatus Hatepunaea meridiana]